MTEAEWLACADLLSMMASLNFTGYDRKARLFSCACVRQTFAVLQDPRSRHAVEMLERYVDGLASWPDVEAAYRDAAAVGTNSAAYLASEEPYLVAFRAATDLNARRPSIYAQVDTAQSELLRDIFGNPFRPVTLDPRWLTSTAVALAQAIYADRAFDRLPILADALEDAGCDDADLLAHCRGSGPHVRGCWAVDLVLGKE